MRLDVSIYAATALLFLLLGYVWYQLLHGVMNTHSRQSRLTYRADRSLSKKLDRRLQRAGRAYNHLSELLETLQMNAQPVRLVALSLMLMIAGIAVGGLFFQSAKGVILMGGVFALLPYMTLRAILIQRRLQTQNDFLPSVELFYQCYLITGGKQLRLALQRTIDERRLIGPMQPVFEQLYRNLSVRDDDEKSLRLFASAIGSVWADYFVNLLRVALTEGVPITEGLKELITDMRKARRANEQERSKLLEIRIANFTPVFFLALFIGINIHYDGSNAYYYYVVDPQGRNMLLNAGLLIFISFLMGLWLSRKKM
ncbi:type II secretion system F family protein [Paenibacillus protaetiae]|uniref:Type II secretion system protein GspF domain-containing protein n=1 Tax=Paenibacillus protaetiae TaxID=2509456 RepID=A0A4P6EV05_9BACL|nr:hypothetical protein [Paenibacillus protaetiae]QAY66832.1 hypothetical protein ET464_10945 [Paenibacillus protaetiae]